MTLTAAEIREVLDEMRPAVVGGWIQKIHQPSDRAIVFEIRIPGKTYRLLISCDHQTGRLHLISGPMRNPQSPLPFCRYLRAHIQGARIDRIEQASNDRIVFLYVTSKAGSRVVVCELTGKTANLLVLDERDRVMRDLNGHREREGRDYHPPDQRRITVSNSARSRFTSPRRGGGYPLSVAMEEHFREEETSRARDQAAEERRRMLNKALKKERRRIEAWKHDLTKSEKYRNYATYGELIKANLHSITKGMAHITLVDYYDETLPEITVPIDPAKSAKANMEDYFKKHRKFLAAERELKPRIARAEQHAATLGQELDSIEQGTWVRPQASNPSQYQRMNKNLGEGSIARERRSPFRRFTSADGLPIYVGRNARENDRLTFGLAKSDDLWLHARGTPGSHVVVRLEKGKDPPIETLLDAATLALLYSDLKTSGKGDVIYTKRKWVKKAKGQAPGSVLVTQEKALHVSLDRQRLDALKARGDGS